MGILCVHGGWRAKDISHFSTNTTWLCANHGLSQQGAWVPFWTPKPLKRTPQDTQIFLCGISNNLNLKLIIEFFHLLIISMTLINDIMPYIDEFIHVYGWNMSILWSPLKIWMPKNLTIANFRHPVSKSWLWPCHEESDFQAWRQFFKSPVHFRCEGVKAYLLVIGIGLDFHDRSSVGYNRSMIDHNRLRMLSSHQHLLAISAAK